MGRSLILWILVLVSSVAWAQVDPSTKLLLQESRSNVGEESLEKSRYSRSKRRQQQNLTRSSQIDQNQDLRQEKTSVSQSNQSGVGGGSDPATKTVENKKPDSKSPTSPTEPDERPSDLEVIEELLPHKGHKATKKYFSNIDQDDERRNILDVSVSPMYFSIHSDSNYWFRDYSAYGPGMAFAARVWFSPFLGLKAEIKSSLSNDIVSSPSGNERIAADHLWVDIGFVFRRFSNSQKSSPILNYEILFRDYALKIPSDSTQRVNLNSSGIVLSVERKGEMENGRRNFLGFEISPKLNHLESAAAVDIQSGNDSETNGVGFWIGQEFQFSRKQVVFWKLKHAVEKNLFGGQANTADPETTISPSGVVVNQSRTFFQIGIKFGN
ncbi:MAG: hypothetical protein KDD61_06815 [Bdellovibrionales bacterium]|nr:hypothetical protein [Bdellovibrionales bacterium]